MEGLEKIHVKYKPLASEHGHQKLNTSLNSKIQSDEDDFQNISNNKLSSSENMIARDIHVASEKDKTTCCIIGTCPSRNSNVSEHAKNSEKAQVESVYESSEFTSNTSTEKEIFTTNVENDLEHLETIDALVTELINVPANEDGQKNTVAGTLTSNQTVKPTQEYRDGTDSWSEDDSASSTSSSSSSSDSEFFQSVVQSYTPKKVIPTVKTKGELGLDELPPIEDLVISVREEEMTLIGNIHAIVDKLVVVHAIKDMKPLDLDTVLFISHEMPLGRVFDVFGPVVKPFYCVRFNSENEINNKGIEIGSDVFFAPEKCDITTYVFVDELQKQKGSDASWKDNNEPPEECLDFSDDEEEKAAKRKRLSILRNRQFSNESDVTPEKPFITENSSQTNSGNYTRPASQKNNSQVHSHQLQGHNLFSSPVVPPPSPVQVQNSFSAPHYPPPATPTVFSVVSAPVRVQNNFYHSTPHQALPFSNPQRQFSHPNVFERPPQLLFTSYQRPVFGQVALLNSMPPPSLPPLVNNTPALISPSHFTQVTPQNYFTQQLPRNPSPYPQMPRNQIYLDQGYPRNSLPVSQGQQVPPNYWFTNRPPNSFQIPPTHPLSVQIPTQNNASVAMHTLQPANVPLQSFVNSGISFQNGNAPHMFY